MKVDRDLVRRVAHLAQIELAEDEIPFFMGQMQDLLGFIDEVQAMEIEANRSNATTEDQLTAANTFERRDVVTPSLPAELVFSNAPAFTGTAFTVPRIIEQ